MAVHAFKKKVDADVVHFVDELFAAMVGTSALNGRVVVLFDFLVEGLIAGGRREVLALRERDASRVTLNGTTVKVGR